MNVFKWLWGPMQNIWDSIKIKDGGFSMRKEIAVVICGCIVWMHLKFVTETNYLTVQNTDYLAIAFLLGLVTMAELIKFKGGGNADGAQDNKPAIPPVIDVTEKANPDIQSSA